MRHRATAFTLLEMLIVTALVGLVAATLYFSLSVSFKARKTAERVVVNLHRGTRAMELVQADLRASIDPQGSALKGDFIGTAGGGAGNISLETAILSFRAAAMDVAPETGVGDIKGIQYACESTGRDEFALVRYVTTNLLPPDGVAVTPKREVLARGLTSFTVRYYDGLSWFDSWDSTLQDFPELPQKQQKKLPLAVQIVLQFKAEGDKTGETVDQTVQLPLGTDQAAIAAAQAAAQALQMGGTP